MLLVLYFSRGCNDSIEIRVKMSEELRQCAVKIELDQ